MFEKYLTDMNRMRYDFGTERNGTERNGTERNGTERNAIIAFIFAAQKINRMSRVYMYDC